MRKLKKERGITLVALIITIVILIVLAVVSITTIMNTDILGYADNSVNIYEKNKDNESETMQNYEDYLSSKGEDKVDSSGEKIFELANVAETKENDMKYSINNGLLKVIGPEFDTYYGYPNKFSKTINIPCTYNLKKRKNI